jgi:hypothetical protein
VYGLRSDIDLSFLTGRELGQVAIGLYQVQFGFDEDVTISVEGQFSYFDGQGESVWTPSRDAVNVASKTVALLGATIESFKAQLDGTLILYFSNAHRLILADSSKEYESYDITRPGQTIIV